MKIGIHDIKGCFSNRWICYCEAQGIDYKLVDCYSSDIIDQLSDCDALMWHFNHKSARASKFAKELLYSVQASGKKVFPDFFSVWHFDDKLGQKYLLEALDLPLVPTYIFYDKNEAQKWAAETSYPKVFKLRNGSASDNVKLVRSRKQANKMIAKAFGRGFKQYERLKNLRERLRKFFLGRTSLWEVFKGFCRLFWPPEYARLTNREKGYAYFQDFIPGNDHDIRIFVVGDKAYGIKRLVRKNDFRASGSMDYVYEKEHFSDEVIQLSFELSDKLRAQCLVFDFVFQEGKPLLVEISFGTVIESFDPCVGYWDRNLNWYEGNFDACGLMVENLIKSEKTHV